MSVDYKSEEFEAWGKIWKKCRDAQSQELMHDASTEYLPMLKSEPTDMYTARLARAVYYEATPRTIEGLNGMLFRKSPVVTSEHEILNSVDLTGYSYTEFMKLAAKEAFEVNRFGLLVDYPDTQGLQTKADAQQAGLEPYIALYKTESILEPKTEKIGGNTVLTQVRLVEAVADDSTDEFEQDTKTQYRVLDLVGGYYRVRIFEIEKDGEIQIGGDIYPKMNGKKMTYIPFYFYPAINIEKPPLLGLVNMNISHYKTTSDLEEGVHIAGKDTLFISGYKPKDGETIYAGGPVAQILPDPQAKAEYVGVSNNFEPHFKLLEKKENQMAILGSRMLEQQKKQVETVEVATMHRAPEAATLSSMSISLSKVFTRAIQTLFDWAGIKEEVTVTLNTDFIPFDIKPELITALLKSVQAGKMSDEAFFNNLKAGEMYQETDTFEDEQARIDNQPPFGVPV
jgi:hypothetical protein